MVFSKKQRTVLTWWMPGSPYEAKEAILCDGAVRSGKTLAMGLGFFLWAQASFDGKKFGICGKTIESLRRNVLSEILPKLEELGATWQEKRSENLLTVRFLGRENRFYIFGGLDERDFAGGTAFVDMENMSSEHSIRLPLKPAVQKYNARS